MKYCFAICLCSLVLATGCKGTVEVNCNDEPNDSACRELCVTEPMLSHCSATDGGIDTGTGDSAVDAEFDTFISNCTDCADPTPICDEPNSMCVQCLLPADCEGVTGRSMCENNSCVECVTNADCSTPGLSVCSTDEGTAGTCVGCSAENAMDCAGVLGDGDIALNVCDESGESPVCVQCNSSNESACNPNVCDVQAKTCADDTPVGLAATCAPCVSDLQCLDGQTCAPTTFLGTDAGYHCLWDLDAPEMAPTACPLPFGNLETVETVGGLNARSCQLRFSTCAAHADHSTAGRQAMNCTGAMTNEADADCGDPTLDDGFCITNAAIGRDHCTVQCGAPIDCVIDGACYGCPDPMGGQPRVCSFNTVDCP